MVQFLNLILLFLYRFSGNISRMPQVFHLFFFLCCFEQEAMAICIDLWNLCLVYLVLFAKLEVIVWELSIRGLKLEIAISKLVIFLSQFFSPFSKRFELFEILIGLFVSVFKLSFKFFDIMDS